MKSFKPFINGDLDSVLRNQLQQITNKIKSENDNYILNVNEDDYIAHLVSEFTLEAPKIYIEGVSASTLERMIPVEQHPNIGFIFYDETKSFNRQVIVVHLPFTGDISLLEFVPNPRILWTHPINYSVLPDNEAEISFEVINFTNDSEAVKRETDQIINNLSTQISHISNQIRGHNENLQNEVSIRLKERKNDLLKKSEFLTQLGIPIRKKDNFPETFSIPSPKIPKKIISKPVASSSSPNPDPTLDLTIYNEILQIIHDFGKAIERLPSTYKGKSEEDLRDHILMQLEPRFEGSATGETFNKAGKTDILLRHNNTNAFVAECKFWGGDKLYLETIDQILSYLTWRDSKSAIILFVKNKDFSAIIDKVKNTTSTHKNYLEAIGEKDEGTWLKYKINLNGDLGREIYLTVLLFHFPDN